jgi:metal-responsive CopG/Arc/MetJ family transcriptional regulator
MAAAFGERRRRVEVRLTDFEMHRLDVIARRRGLSRSGALREAIAWLAAKDAWWAERARQARIAKLLREADELDPITDVLAFADRRDGGGNA